jgi:molybdopterin-biosynthesis enzyme MoeA-like protein
MEKSLKTKGQAINEARRRMALFPWPAEVHFWNDDRWVPIVQIDNVFILPGIPALFESMLEGGKHLFAGGQPPVSADVFTQLFEGGSFMRPLLERSR